MTHCSTISNKNIWMVLLFSFLMIIEDASPLLKNLVGHNRPTKAGGNTLPQFTSSPTFVSPGYSPVAPVFTVAPVSDDDQYSTLPQFSSAPAYSPLEPVFDDDSVDEFDDSVDEDNAN
eukprot:CAMPEP_0194137520 /NCGR_PEP_ID=MMETSP0152-20130528/7412_1 /TAXON_ID=1049557 /ORGANISM="Thalassiothrix antarctica, Strain L6-D1" /LENGTH=117 /DNA_ID=CAMNT_0038834583 /DNA_START=171 /DNA_END=524 /DNA_ORIENTATION=+